MTLFKLSLGGANIEGILPKNNLMFSTVMHIIVCSPLSNLFSKGFVDKG